VNRAGRQETIEGEGGGGLLVLDSEALEVMDITRFTKKATVLTSSGTVSGGGRVGLSAAKVRKMAKVTGGKRGSDFFFTIE
jgi:hypothetical protein